MKRILVADDEEDMCMILKMLLENDGYEVITATTGKDVLQYITDGGKPDLIITDLKMPDIQGTEILNFLNETGRDIPLVLITAYGTIEVAVEAMKNGAVDFITKPFNKDVIRHIIRRIFRIDSMERENEFSKEAIQEREIVYISPAMHELMDTVKKVACVKTPVLIAGESGSGKELVARALHYYGGTTGSDGVDRPLVSINCPTVPESLFESELFGYQRGAFTGALRDYQGKIRMAEGGTLFLDEIGDLPLSIQPKLLRFLEEKTFEPLGSNVEIRVNTRVVCSTNRDLRAMVKEGKFREDLYYRINAITLEVPPLRERREDILPLAEYFIEKNAQETGKGRKTLSHPVEKLFKRYNWPGNVRELKNVIERAVVLSTDKEIKLTHIPSELRSNFSLDKEEFSCNRFDSIERQLLLESLEKNNWNITAVARELGTTRSTIRYRIKKFGIKK